MPTLSYPGVKARSAMRIRFFLLAATIFAVTVNAQDLPSVPLANEDVEKSTASQCLEPPPIVRFEDYTGPFANVAASFARKLENRTVHVPHYKAGVLLCSLEPRAKFMLFITLVLNSFSG